MRRLGERSGLLIDCKVNEAPAIGADVKLFVPNEFVYRVCDKEVAIGLCNE